ncbi:MAG: EVE domain-containing protein [Deinococcus-Thermus bacterium]|jgi:predicted RNA-binding protein with PUA-like domain|nr:EVE domain-containing protein [Deinococcota bacterium]
MPRTWLLKSEPDAYSFGDLERDGRTPWDGIRNYQARNFMRDEMAVGDRVLYYHSNTQPPGVVGVAEVVSEPYPDPTQFDEESRYFDPKATREEPRWILVDVAPVRRLPRIVTLAEIKDEAALAEMPLVRRGNRLSVMPVSEDEAGRILEMAERPAPEGG